MFHLPVPNFRHVIGIFFVSLWMATPAPAGAAAPRQDASAAPAPPCVAIMLPSVKGVTGQSDEAAGAVRDLLASYLTAPAFKTVALDAKLAALAMSEAREKGCANVVTMTVTGKQGGGSRFGGLGRLAGQTVGSAAPYLGGGSAAGAIARGAAIGTTQALASMASNTKARDELKLEFTVQTTDNAVRVPKTTHEAKAQSDGEDIVTPVIEKVATQIADVMLKAPR
jgi:hypothetical protein